MSQFEYLAISVAILISIAVARMISGLPHALRGARRYPLHYGWIIVWLWGIVMSWWGIWNYRELEWTFVRFLLFLSPSGPLLFIAYTLVPDNPERVESWKEHFYAVRAPLFGASILFYIVLLLNQSVLEFIPILDFRRLAPTLLLSAALVGFATRSARAQGIVFGVKARVQIYHVDRMNAEQIASLDRQKTVVILTGGILEEHGPHLPSFTDGYSNEWLAQS